MSWKGWSGIWPPAGSGSGCSELFFPSLQEETAAEAAPGGCEEEEEEGASWTAGDPVACSEAAAAETEVASEVAGAWIEVATEEEDGEEEDPEAPLAP